MKTSLDHLPEDRRAQITAVAALLTASAPVEMLRQEGREEGLREGEALGQARALFTVLSARGIAIPEVDRQRILATTDTALLEQWLTRATTARSLDEVFRDEP